jgi:hypothetical protein
VYVVESIVFIVLPVGQAAEAAQLCSNSNEAVFLLVFEFFLPVRKAAEAAQLAGERESEGDCDGALSGNITVTKTSWTFISGKVLQTRVFQTEFRDPQRFSVNQQPIPIQSSSFVSRSVAG